MKDKLLEEAKKIVNEELSLLNLQNEFESKISETVKILLKMNEYFQIGTGKYDTEVKKIRSVLDQLNQINKTIRSL